ncbi:SRPBCC family protein [Herbiconiux sp. KACC 21604]|uniref:SRPBCC family protein n=1 Tax=unclassified Herbiconiux TaxID=2618217 RepID=UPI001491DCCA|nr:SRPBCC family protein [Herbiconiux sp. SALV-R1]QJU53441.1 SRPBCC family protein [Herbiconiux sp. SALV-R1]WPO88410.1 SRPBCC family protein [Herbiconiux sp. KACC 21604]
MARAQHSETIHAPIAAVYQQWLDVEAFPRFVLAVREVSVTAELYSHWTLSLAGIEREFDIEIVEQAPERRVSWRSITGEPAHTAGADFTEDADDRTTVTVTLEWTPDGPAERSAALLKADTHALRTALRGFKRYVEQHGGPSGHSHVVVQPLDADPSAN